LAGVIAGRTTNPDRGGSVATILDENFVLLEYSSNLECKLIVNESYIALNLNQFTDSPRVSTSIKEESFKTPKAIFTNLGDNYFKKNQYSFYETNYLL
jgi:hypothetical protein